MAQNSFKLEIDYFGFKVIKELVRLEDIVGLTISLGPYVKIGIRDLRPDATYHTTVGIHQQDPGKPRPPFRIPLEGGDGNLSLVPITMEIFGWRHLTVNGRRQAPAMDAGNSATFNGIPPAVPGYDARRNIFLQMPVQAAVNGPPDYRDPARVSAPSSPDSGIGTSTSGGSDGEPEAGDRVVARPIFQRQMARRGRRRSSPSSDADKRPRHE